MTTTENLWPEISIDEVLKSPKTILNEQAKFLAQSTKNLLSANVATSTDGSGGFIHYFEIIAPNLGGYKYRLLYLKQNSVFFYPCELVNQNIGYHLEAEKDLIDVLGSIFKNDETNKVVKSLIAQSKSEISEYV